jgi:hypothetical protein
MAFGCCLLSSRSSEKVVFSQIKTPPEQQSLVGAGGFEPPASRTRTVRATGLRYAPIKTDYTLTNLNLTIKIRAFINQNEKKRAMYGK